MKRIDGHLTRVFSYRASLKVLGAFLWLLSMVAPQTHAGQATTIAPSGETVIATRSGKISVQVKITTHEVQIGKPSGERPGLITTSCTYSRFPCSVVDLITIQVNGNPITVPRVAFCGLADLNDAELIVGQQESVLKFSGGDASESYRVKIRFNRERVTDLSVFNGESGKKLQETTYFKVVVEDE